MHGGQNEKTFERLASVEAGRMDTKGRWSIKERRGVGVKVACFLSSSGTWTRATQKHYVMCSHGTRREAHGDLVATSRAKALKLAKMSDKWCGHCAKLADARNSKDEEE